MINRILPYTTEDQRQNKGSQFQGASWWPKDLKQVLGPVESAIVNYPEAAVAAAFLCGVALAWWIKRSK
jgi:hypothetical protein